jgi:HK97 family phage portal protein
MPNFFGNIFSNRVNRAQSNVAGLSATILPTGSQNVAAPRDTRAYLEAFNTMPWLRSVVGKIADSTASVEWQVYVARSKRTNTRKQYVHDPAVYRALTVSDPLVRGRAIRALESTGELELVTSHPIYDALNPTGNSTGFTGTDLRYLIQVYLDVVGESYIIKERNDRGLVINLWPVISTMITSLATNQEPYYKMLINGVQVDIPVSEIIRFKVPNPLSPYGRSRGLAQSLEDELNIDEMAAKHIASFFLNRARPDLLIYGDGLKPEHTQRIEADWNARNQGFWKSFKPYFLSKNVQIKELAQDFSAMKVVELRNQERDTILHVIGIPPEILGILDSSNRATIESAEYLYNRQLIIPRLERLRATFQSQLALDFDDRIILQYVSPVMEDKEFILKSMQSSPWAFTVDEWRAVSHYPALPESTGNIFMVPNNLVSTRDLSAIPQPLTTGPIQPTAKAVASLPTVEIISGSQSSIPLQAGSNNRAGADQLVYRRDEEVDQTNSLLEKFEKDVVRYVTNAASDAQDEVNDDQVISAILRRDSDTAIDAVKPDSFGSGLNDIDDQHLSAAVNVGGSYAANVLGRLGLNIEFDITNPKAVDWAKLAAGQLVTNINLDTLRVIRDAISHCIDMDYPPEQAVEIIKSVIGLHSGQIGAVQKLTDKLLKDGIEWSTIQKRVHAYSEALIEQRATMIARTEIMASLNYGKGLLWDQAITAGLIDPRKTRQVWIPWLDTDIDVCEEMPYLEQNKNVPVGGEFTDANGRTYRYPPAHPHCRCTIGLEFTS